MRASRAYIASLGTTGVLIASGLMLLVVVSAIVAFQGWPGQGLLNDLESLVVDEERPALALSGPEQIAADAAPAAAAVAAAPAPGTAAAAPAGAGTAGQAPTFTPGGGQPGSGPVVVTPGVPVPSGQVPGVVDGAPSVAVPPEVQGVTNSLGRTTESVTGALGDTVGQVNPGLGNTVTETGQNLSKLVQGLGLPQSAAP